MTEPNLLLQGNQKLKLINWVSQSSKNFSTYIKTSKVSWYWITLALVAIAALTFFALPETLDIFNLMRIILGAIFVFWLPGYSFVKIFFSGSMSSSHNFDTAETIALSIGMSLAIVCIVGLFLYYTWGINLVSVVLCLISLTLIFSTSAVFRDYFQEDGAT